MEFYKIIILIIYVYIFLFGFDIKIKRCGIDVSLVLNGVLKKRTK